MRGMKQQRGKCSVARSEGREHERRRDAKAARLACPEGFARPADELVTVRSEDDLLFRLSTILWKVWDDAVDGR